MAVRGAILLFFAMAACTDTPPTGQVVARVDGIEITRRDILIELMACGAPADVDTAKVLPDVLDQIIIRKLLALEARRKLIDRSPEFLGQERRNRELLLGRLLLERITGELAPPSQASSAAEAKLREDVSRRLVRQTISRLRANARIEYQPRPGRS